MRMPNSQIDWVKIAIFYALAFSLSGIFNSGLLTTYYENWTNGILIQKWPFLPAGFGTLIAALLSFKFDRNLKRTVTLLGNNILKNISICLVPVLVFTVIGVSNNNAINVHYYGLSFSFVALLYGLSEEIFWRSYLLDSLRPLKKSSYSLVIGILWWAWHFRFANGFDFTGFLFICVASSFLLCQFANETKSYLTAAGLHSLIIVTTSEGEMTLAKTLSMCICIALWLLIGKLWKTKDTLMESGSVSL